LYLKKRWLLLFFTVVIVVLGSYLYINFFSSDKAEPPCCVKHKVVIPPVFSITESTPITNLDSSKANQTITYNILNQIQEGLMRLGTKDIPVLGLAESYQVSPDYRTYTFTIRKNAKWSDGKPVTANDFLYAWKRVLTPTNHYEYGYLFFPIHNAEAYYKGEITADQLGVSAPDDNHLVVKLVNPDPNFLSLVTHTTFLPGRLDLVKKYGDDYASVPDKMSFTGPFQLKTVTPKKAVLVKNEMYWDKANVYLPEVAINVEVDPAKQVDLFKSELTGMIKLDPQYAIPFKTDTNLKIAPKAITDYIEMNQRKSLFQNIHIRKAIQLALNRDDIATVLQDGSTKADEIVPPVLKTSRNEAFRAGIKLPFHLEEAKTNLNKGYQELGIAQPSVLTLVTYNDQHSITLADHVKKQLHAIGLEVNVKKYDPNKKSQVEPNGDYDLSVSEWSADYHDPATFLSLWHSAMPENISGFQNSNYDSLLDRATIEEDPVKQVKFLQQAEKYLLKDQAVIVPLVYLNDFRLQKSYVKNVLYHPFGAEYTLKWATYRK
jgi:oligopeptide transport system substrate-binding protein